MIFLEDFKPVKHLAEFNFFYEKALFSLCHVLNEQLSKINTINNHKQKCIFEKKILIYKKNNEQIGFCMYEIIDDVVYIILDYVDKKFKGCGRKCRELLIFHFKNKTRELRLKIHTSNKISLNSARKIIPVVSHFCDVKENGFDNFSEYVEFIVEY